MNIQWICFVRGVIKVKEIVIYTDGSCLKKPNGQGGCAAILHYEKMGSHMRKRNLFPVRVQQITKWKSWLL